MSQFTLNFRDVQTIIISLFLLFLYLYYTGQFFEILRIPSEGKELVTISLVTLSLFIVFPFLFYEYVNFIPNHLWYLPKLETLYLKKSFNILKIYTHLYQIHNLWETDFVISTTEEAWILYSVGKLVTVWFLVFSFFFFSRLNSETRR